MRRQLAGIQLVAGREPVVAPARRPGPFIKLCARLRGASLDRAIATGADPSSSALLARRAAWLTSARNRRSLSRSIDRLLAVRPAPRGPSAAVRPHGGELAGTRLSLARVAALLAGGEPVYCRGVARVQLLLTQGNSPLFAPERVGQLQVETDEILDALEGREQTC